MKKTLLYFFMLSFYGFVNAQTYTPLGISSGFTEDVIANGIGAALVSTSGGLDNANFCLMASDFQATAANATLSYALPTSGLFSSPSTSGLTYQMASFSGNNSARIVNQNESVTLTFSNQVAASNLYFLATSGSGPTTFTCTVTFADNTTQATTGTVLDWFNGNSLPIVTSGIGRIGRNDNIIENPGSNPRLYQWAMPILTANQTKLLSSVQFTKTSTVEGVLNVFAASAQLSTLGISDVTVPKFSVYPNPFSSFLNILGNDSIEEVRIFNMLGQEVLCKKNFGGNNTLNTENLSSGNYVMKVGSGNGTQSFHLIKD